MTRPTKGAETGEGGHSGRKFHRAVRPPKEEGVEMHRRERAEDRPAVGPAEVTCSEAGMGPAEVALGGTPVVLEQRAVGRVSRSRLADRAERGGESRGAGKARRSELLAGSTQRARKGGLPRGSGQGGGSGGAPERWAGCGDRGGAEEGQAG